MKAKKHLILTIFSLIFVISLVAETKNQKLSAGSKRSLFLNEQGVIAMKNRNYKQAEDSFRESLSKDNYNLTAVYNLAGAYVSNKKEQEAIDLLTKYIEKQPKDAGLWARLGDTYFTFKNPKKAIEAYEKALKLEPGLHDLLVKSATAYSLLGDTKKAEALLTQASSFFPNDAQLLSNLASLQLTNANNQEAIRTSKRSLQIKPLSETYITLGNAYELEKDYKNALIAFKRAQDLGNKKPELEEKIKELKKLG